MSGGIKLRNADFTRTYPPALKHDTKMIAFAKAVSSALRENAQLLERVGFYYRIDELDEATLDILAADLHVDWYDPEADLDTKRTVIKSSIYIHRKMGTPAAVQRVIEDNFGSGAVQEWFDYGGEPYHFRVSTENIQQVNANLNKFLGMLEKAKKASAMLDGVEIVQNCSMTVGVGLAIKTNQERTMRTNQVDVSEVNFLIDENGAILIDELGRILTV